MSKPKDENKDENIGNVDPMVEIEMEDRMLPVPMTDQERLVVGEELARAQEEAEQAELKKEAMDDEYKGVIKKAYERVSVHAKQLRHGKVSKAVQCRISKDYRLGWIRIHRLDDQSELISRPMTSEERQTGLSFEGRQDGD